MLIEASIVQTRPHALIYTLFTTQQLTANATPHPKLLHHSSERRVASLQLERLGQREISCSRVTPHRSSALASGSNAISYFRFAFEQIGGIVFPHAVFGCLGSHSAGLERWW